MSKITFPKSSGHVKVDVLMKGETTDSPQAIRGVQIQLLTDHGHAELVINDEALPALIDALFKSQQRIELIRADWAGEPAPESSVLIALTLTEAKALAASHPSEALAAAKTALHAALEANAR